MHTEAVEPALADAARRAASGTLFLLPESGTPCGVEDFARGLLAALRRDAGDCTGLTLGRRTGSLREVVRALDGAGSVAINLPIVAWKRAILKPLAALALARLRGRRVVAILHEWAGLHPFRRHALRPALLMADRIVLFSPQIRRELEADPTVAALARRAVLAPLPPNVRRPPATRAIPLAGELAAARREGRLIIGAFGSIYPGKQPEALLNVAAALKARGTRPLLVMIGSFIRGADQVEAEFWGRAAALGLRDDVIVSGYVGTEAELFGLFDQVGVFLSLFGEGLTARRSSVLAVVQSRRPVVASAPAAPDEFAHHPRFRALLESGAVRLVARDASPDLCADAVLAAAEAPAAPAPLDVEAWWRDAADAIRPLLAASPLQAAVPNRRR